MLGTSGSLMNTGPPFLRITTWIRGTCRGANTGRFGNFGVFPLFYMVFWARKRRKSH